MQDVRWYKAAKYTSAFTAPVRNDFNVTNLITTSSTTVYSTGLTGSSGSAFNNPAWYGFDGLADNNMAYDGNGVNTSLSWTNPAGSGVTALGSGLRIFPRATNGGSRTFTLNGADTTTLAANGWTTISVGSQTHLNSFTITGGEAYLSAVEVNGSILVDAALSDVLNDSPTNYEDGSTAHGNYCTLNPVAKGSNLTLSQGNLNITGTNGTLAVCLGTMAVSSGKWYYEFTFNNSSKLSFIAGITNRTTTDDLADWQEPGDYSWNGNGNTWHDIYANGVAQTDFSGDGPTAAGDVIGVLLDFTNTTITIKLNNSTKGTLTTSLPAGLYFPLIGNGSGAAELDATINFGQSAFKYPQRGFNGWCTQNLDDFDTDNNPSKYFDILTYSGTGSALTLKGLNFGPDLVWAKARSGQNNHILQDQAGTGTSEYLRTDSNAAAGTAGGVPVSAFNSNGVTLGTNDRANWSGNTHVLWAWDAGTSAATASTDGSITPDAQWVNATAGFSISKYEGTGGNATIGHALGAKPHMFIVKRLNSAADWRVYHQSLGNAKAGNLDSHVGGSNINTSMWQSTDPTNTVVSLSSDANGNANGDTYAMYAWTEISQFSKFGTYTGNGSTDGPMINLGFRPKWFMLKETNTANDSSNDWYILDSARSPNNEVVKSLKANEDGAEATDSNFVDFVSNGVKFRTSGGAVNGSGDTYIFAAFAEHPFKTSRAQ